MKNKKDNKKVVNNKTVQDIIDIPPSDTDPNGSYTGKPKNKYEKPQQDADDL